MLDKLLGGTIYIRVYYNRMRLRRAETGEEVDLNATGAFSHQRSVIADFPKAEALLKNGLKSLKKLTSPVAVIQAAQLADGGLTQIEERALHELCLSAGAVKAIVWQGHELTDEEVIGMARTK